MRQLCSTAFCAYLATAFLSPCFAHRPQDFTADPGLLQFLEQLAEATYQFNVGNPDPYLALLSSTEELTLMGAAGGMEKGIAQIRPRVDAIRRLRTEAQRFEDNQAEIEYSSIVSTGDLAYTVQIERRRLSRAGEDEPEDSVLRATHVLRKENGEWKLLHRHADPLVEVTVPGIASPQR